MTTEKADTLPHSPDSENAVLGALMLDNRQWYAVRAIVGTDDFFRHENRLVFGAIEKLLNAGKPCDFITLTEKMRQAGTLDEVGGVPALASFSNEAWGLSNAETYAKQIRDYSQRRRLMEFSRELYREAMVSDSEDATAFLMARVNGLMTKSTAKSKRFQEAATSAQDSIAEAGRRIAAGGTVGAPTGLRSLDRLIGGFTGPRLYILAARPKCGKSALLNQFAIHAAREGHAGLLVTRELGSDEIAIRAMSMLGDVNVTRLHRGSVEEAKRGGDATSRIGDIPLWIDDETATLDAICAQIALHKFRHGIAWAAVDHIGLVRTEQRFNSRNDQLGHISWTLKETAKRLKIPIIALSQLNRSSAKEGRRPSVHDLRDSGNIEQDADAVIMMHVAPEHAEDADKPVSIGVPANRTGPSMWLDTPFTFKGATQTFLDGAA